MTHSEKSAGGRLLSDNDSQTEDAAVSREQATATLAGGIAGDAAVLIELIEELINRGGSDDSALSGAVAMLARVGAMADTISAAHGGPLWHGDAADWLITGQTYRQAHKALAALNPQGVA